jgi:hypothetical protein
MDPSLLRPAYAGSAPVVTAVLVTDRHTEHAARSWEIRRGDLRGELVRRRVDAATAAALVQGMGDYGNADAVLLVGAAGRLLLRHEMLDQPAGRSLVDEITVGPLPRLLPVITDLDHRVPHITVLVDHAGAGVVVSTPDGVARVSEQKGPEDAAHRQRHKVPGGGWSHMRYQRRVENNWDAVARDVAAQLDHDVVRTRAEALFVGGDPHSVEMLEARLGKRARSLVVEVDGSRARGNDPERTGAQVRAGLARVHDVKALGYLDQLAARKGRNGTPRAVEGIPAVVEALRAGLVDTLLVAPREIDLDRALLVGPEPEQVGVTVEELAVIGGTDPQPAPAVDAVLRLAAVTGAQVATVPAGTDLTPRDGLGALLRGLAAVR